MPRININNNKKCVGCFACASSCPKNAITIKLDTKGFFVPILDENLCVECGKCVKTCPTLTLAEKRMPIEQYAGWNNNEEEKYNSTSGGIFIALANKILKDKGIVFGAAFSDDFTEVYHTDTDTVDIKKLQKSKYTSSNLNNTFDKILEISKTDRKILFVGTPCQCAGLRRLVGNKDNIYIVDFICGGNSSAKAFKEYMTNKQKKCALQDFDFRSKKANWGMYYYYYYYKNGKKEMDLYNMDPYFSSFVNHISTNINCDTCVFRKRHESDLTIADFWGYKKTDIPYNKDGISLIAVNNEQGNKLLNKLNNCYLENIDKQYIEYAYKEKVMDEKKEKLKKQFFKDLEQNNFNKISYKYFYKDIIILKFKSFLRNKEIIKYIYNINKR